MTHSNKFIPLSQYREYPVAEMQRRAADFYVDIRRRRTVRDFADRPVPRQIIENCILAAGTAPNGANMQPWHFVVVSSPEIKKKFGRQPRPRNEPFTRNVLRKNGLKHWLRWARVQRNLSWKVRLFSSSFLPKIMRSRPRVKRSSITTSRSRWVLPPAS